MPAIRYIENVQVTPVLAPQSVASSGASAYVDLNLSHWVTFLVHVGAMTSDTTDIITITLEASTAGSSNATEVALPFQYRRATLNTDSWGSITTVSTAGLAITATDDNTLFAIDYDPAALETDAAAADYRYLRVVLTAGVGLDTATAAVEAVTEPRYKSKTNQSSS